MWCTVLRFLARIDSFTVPLHSPKGRQMPAVRAVQGDCQWHKKTDGNSTMHCNNGESSLIFRPTNHKWVMPLGDASQSKAMTVLLPPGWDCVAVYGEIEQPLKITLLWTCSLGSPVLVVFHRLCIFDVRLASGTTPCCVRLNTSKKY